MDIIKQIIENLKDGSKKPIWMITAILGFYYLKTKAPELYSKLGVTLVKCFEISLQHIITVIVTIILFYIIIKILKYSNKKFYDELDRRYPDTSKYESKVKTPISIVIFEKYQKHSKEKNYNREIVLKNEIDKEIAYIKGTIEFYDDNVRFKIVPFEIHNLYRFKSHRIIYESIRDDEIFWNEFKIEISTIIYDKTVEKNITLEGMSFHRIPSNFKAKSKFEYLIPYDLEWLKDQFAIKIIPRIKWYFKIKKVYKKFPYEENLIEKIKHIRILLPISITITIFSLTLFYLWHLGEFLYSFIKIWVQFFVDLFV